MTFRSIVLLPILVIFGVAEHAAASGFQLIEQNASGIGNAFGGSAAVAENASTIFFNPAGMTQLRARAISAGISAVRPSFKFTDNGSSIPTTLPPGYVPLSGEGGDGGSLAYIPNGYFSSALDKDLYVGIGFSSPFGLITEYDDAWFGAAQSVKFDIKTYNINPSIAYRVNDTLSLGLGINWMRMDAEYTKRYASTKTPPGIVPATASNPTATLKADANAWGWNVGALFDLSPTTRIGLSYRSTIKQKLDGTLAIDGGSPFDTKADIKLPDTVILSIVHRIDPRWEMLGDISWTGWSSIPRVDIVRKKDGVTVQTLDTAFNDSWRFAIGANYTLTEAWKLKFGLARDNTPVPDASRRLVSLPDNDRFWLSAGIQWKPSRQTTLDMGMAYIRVRSTDINAVNTASGTTVKGSYDSSIRILGLQYSQSF